MPSGVGSGGGCSSSRAISGASFSSAFSPIRGSEAWPATPDVFSRTRKIPFSPTASV